MFNHTVRDPKLRAFLAAQSGDHCLPPSLAPAAIHAAKRPVVLVQNSIHAGEMDGKDACLALLRDIKARGERVYGVGAPSRASTLINYVGLDDGILDCVLEIKGSYKIGKYIPGTVIPVLDEAKLFDHLLDFIANARCLTIIANHNGENIGPLGLHHGFQ